MQVQTMLQTTFSYIGLKFFRNHTILSDLADLAFLCFSFSFISCTYLDMSLLLINGIYEKFE